MTVYVNQKSCDCNATTIAELSSELGLEQMVAIAVNNRVIARNEWDSTPLREGDKVTIVKVACGG